jgi:hypothetical protein
VSSTSTCLSVPSKCTDRWLITFGGIEVVIRQWWEQLQLDQIAFLVKPFRLDRASYDIEAYPSGSAQRTAVKRWPHQET